MAVKQSFLSFRILAACGVGIYVAWKIKQYYQNPLRKKEVVIVSNAADCKWAVTRLREDLDQFPVLGFGSESMTEGGSVDLLQLSSTSGFTALIRLCHLQEVPEDLKKLLEDETILKVCVQSLYLGCSKYNVKVKGTVFLWHLTTAFEIPVTVPEGLAGMSKCIIGVELTQKSKLSSFWNHPILTEKQVEHASNHSLASIEIFKKMLTIYKEKEGGHTVNFMHLANTFKDRAFHYTCENINNRITYKFH